jgi:hypothetical protein
LRVGSICRCRSQRALLSNSVSTSRRK